MAGEMISGQNRQMSFLEVMQRTFNYQAGQLGDVYIKFLDPINVKEFV